MFRVVCVIVAAMAGTLFTPVSGSAQTKGITLGKKFEGKVGNTKNRYENIPGSGILSFDAYAAELPITLKAGQSISISATVTGTGRAVWLALLDPTEKAIH